MTESPESSSHRKRSKSIIRAKSFLHRERSGSKSEEIIKHSIPSSSASASAQVHQNGSAQSMNASLTSDPARSSPHQSPQPTYPSSLSHSRSLRRKSTATSNPDDSLRSTPSSLRSSMPGSSEELPASSRGDMEQQQQQQQHEERSPSQGPNHAHGRGHGHKPSMSIDQSVRIFRIFEVLRSGDTTAIAKTIKECADPQSEPLGTTVLHLAIQCTEPQIVEYVLSHDNEININARDRDGNTPLHLAAQLGRLSIVRNLLDRPKINDAVTNYAGQTPLDLSRSPEIFQALQLSRSLFMDDKIKEIQALVAVGDYDKLEHLLMEPRVEGVLDVNCLDLVSDKATAVTGGTLLHEAARKRDTRLIQLLLMHGADPFQRDRKGKLPQDVTKDDKTRAILKRSPAAVMAQEKTMLSGVVPSSGQSADGTPGGKDSREKKGYLKKWTNYTGGYKLRWFVLEDGVMSYYKHQDDIGSACRGAINMRIAKLHMDPSDPTRFEIQGKSSVKYHLKANHKVEAKSWFWTLNNAIQWTKDEAKEEERRRNRDAETFRQAKMEQSDRIDQSSSPNDLVTRKVSSRSISQQPPPSTSMQFSNSPPSSMPRPDSRRPPSDFTYDDEAAFDRWSLGSTDGLRMSQIPNQTILEAEDDVGDDYASSKEFQPAMNKDAFNITAQSLKLQLDILNNIYTNLKELKTKAPQTVLSDPAINRCVAAYDGTVSNINLLIGDLLKISKDRDAFWQYRLDREVEARKMWEDSMARVAEEHEQLQRQIGESEMKRRRTKKALKGALENFNLRDDVSTGSQDPNNISETATAVDADKMTLQENRPAGEGASGQSQAEQLRAQSAETLTRSRPQSVADGKQRWSIVKTLAEDLSEDDSDEDAEFFDALDAGNVEVQPPQYLEKTELEGDSKALILRRNKEEEIEPAFLGYEEGIRKRLKLDADNRPKLSLWSILKSMIGKDMTKMTLPVSFNEPTSLLQRVAEDLEYTDLLDIAADRPDSMQRLVYVAAFAASEYASTIGRVAKPFNPLLGETYEYVRPDKGYRFYIEQVSHHPPIGAAYAESPKWDYWGESAVKSKFYGKSFDINPLGTWFLRLRSVDGKEELYTWKKVTSTVIGIITGSPAVDNYGPMEVKNWSTGEVCILDFKPRGWKVSSAYHVSGKAMDKNGNVIWSLGGRWNDKIFARHTPGFQDTAVSTSTESSTQLSSSASGSKAFIIWQANPRPEGIPFNLTPFVVTLNAINDSLKEHLPPTDTRLRPDQRAMEDGEYDKAADEKHRVEEKQRAARRRRETQGEEWMPRWFTKGVHEITGDPYWMTNGEYWKCREKHDWSRCDDIF